MTSGHVAPGCVPAHNYGPIVTKKKSTKNRLHVAPPGPRLLLAAATAGEKKKKKGKLSFVRRGSGHNRAEMSN